MNTRVYLMKTMSDDIDVKQIEQTAVRESMRDGLTELFTGLMLLMAGAMFGKPYFVIYIPIFTIILAPFAIKALKSTYTYPRVGYAQPRLPDSSIRAMAALVVVVIAVPAVILYLLYGTVTDIYLWAQWIPLVLGLFMFGPTLYLVETTGQSRYYAFGILTTITGVAASLVEFDTTYGGIAFYLICWGITLTVLGTIIFVRFVHKYPVLEQTEAGVNER